VQGSPIEIKGGTIAPKDQSNRRKYMPDDAVWEIHPVMALHVDQ